MGGRPSDSEVNQLNDECRTRSRAFLPGWSALSPNQFSVYSIILRATTQRSIIP
jgi:hypothetical protein